LNNVSAPRETIGKVKNTKARGAHLGVLRLSRTRYRRGRGGRRKGRKQEVIELGERECEEGRGLILLAGNVRLVLKKTEGAGNQRELKRKKQRGGARYRSPRTKVQEIAGEAESKAKGRN